MGDVTATPLPGGDSVYLPYGPQRAQMGRIPRECGGKTRQIAPEARCEALSTGRPVQIRDN